jgi:SAM-dependent methyltransferase
MWNSGWDEIFSKTEWGKYPSEELVRFIGRKFFAAPVRKEVRILEVGCGTGANLWFLSREGFSTFGIDGSSIAVDRAKTRMQKEGLNAELKTGDIVNLPYESEYFDAVIDIECIYANDLVSTEKILNEVHRVLKPRGYFFSQAFSSGMTGEETAERYNGEPRTYSSMPDGPLRSEYGVIRLTERTEISDLYGIFRDLQVDYIERTKSNSESKLKEWVIVGSK